MAELEDLVKFKCVKVKNKLRVRVISPGYNHDANCQFPRAIRQPGRHYSAPVVDLKFARGPAGKFFYRVSKKNIKIIENIDDEQHPVKVDKIYGEDSPECVICFENDHQVVLARCGHYIMCIDCADKIYKSSGICPMCRCKIDAVVLRDQIQM